MADPATPEADLAHPRPNRERMTLMAAELAGAARDSDGDGCVNGWPAGGRGDGSGWPAQLAVAEADVERTRRRGR
uniref:Uncharacterized protein n=1 Tax=Oryza barthii TaxID=65489 RepID=A0A0D3ENZ5_9ORYZ